MKPNIWYKKFMFVMLTLFINCILSGCGSGTTSSGSINNTTPVSLGVLSNSSTLYTSTSSFPISDAGTTASGILSLVGGIPNASFTIIFGASVLQGTQKAHTSNKHLQSADQMV